MELRQLEYFRAICKDFHFTRAAENLGITQPTLSHQIKALENEVGVPLFNRIGKKITITEAGSILLEETNKIFSSLKLFRDHIFELNQMERGSLIVGVLPGELNQMASNLLLDFHRNHPLIKLKIVGADDIVERVLNNELDLALTILPRLPFNDDKLTTVSLYRENFYLAVSSADPLAKKEKINFEEIKSMPIIMFPNTHQCRKLIDITCDNAGFYLDPFIETSTIESLFSLVKAGAGATILSKTLLELYNTDGKLKVIPIEKPVLAREIGIVYLKEKYLGFAARGFIKILTSYILELKGINLEEIKRV